MKYFMTCLLAAALVGCEQGADTTDSQAAKSGADDAALENTAPEPVREPVGKVVEYGLYKPVRKGRMRDEITTNTGKLINKPVLEFTEEADRIPLVKGTYFAYRFQLWDLPKEVAKKPIVEVRKVLVHPEMKLPDGDTSTGWDRVSKVRISAGQAIGFDGYAFNEDYELVEGDWTFQIWFQDQILTEQTFTTYWPEEGADPGADTEAEQSGAGQPAAEPEPEPAEEKPI
jgi:hypothetical protein